MKKLLFSAALLMLISIIQSCRPTTVPEPVTDPDPVTNLPFFNQQQTEFRLSQTNKLLDFWYARRSKAQVEFAVINDEQSYQAFFGQNSLDSLPAIDFKQYTLLVGNRGGYGSFIDGPANIKTIQQNVEKLPSGELTYAVTVTARSKGQEWFGFSTLVPRVEKPETVKLTIQYKIE